GIAANQVLRFIDGFSRAVREKVDFGKVLADFRAGCIDSVSSLVKVDRFGRVFGVTGGLEFLLVKVPHGHVVIRLCALVWGKAALGRRLRRRSLLLVLSQHCGPCGAKNQQRHCQKSHVHSGLGAFDYPTSLRAVIAPQRPVFHPIWPLLIGCYLAPEGVLYCIVVELFIVNKDTDRSPSYSLLMAKMPDPRKYHRHTQAVSGGNDFLVAY